MSAEIEVERILASRWYIRENTSGFSVWTAQKSKHQERVVLTVQGYDYEGSERRKLAKVLAEALVAEHNNQLENQGSAGGQ